MGVVCVAIVVCVVATCIDASQPREAHRARSSWVPNQMTLIKRGDRSYLVGTGTEEEVRDAIENTHPDQYSVTYSTGKPVTVVDVWKRKNDRLREDANNLSGAIGQIDSTSRIPKSRLRKH